MDVDKAELWQAMSVQCKSSLVQVYIKPLSLGKVSSEPWSHEKGKTLFF